MKTITTDGGIHRRVTPSADMSWLGDPPTPELAARYERLRDGKIALGLLVERIELEAESRQLMLDISASESPVRRARLIEMLRETNMILNKPQKAPTE